MIDFSRPYRLIIARLGGEVALGYDKLWRRRLQAAEKDLLAESSSVQGRMHYRELRGDLMLTLAERFNVLYE